MRGFALLLCMLAATAAAQQPPLPSPPPESTHAESTHAESTPLFAAPTPAQARYLQGLRTAGRGVAQLRDGAARVTNSGGDSLRLLLASRRLGGLCGAARGFMVTGRSRMLVTAYEDSTGLRARRLVALLDTLIRYTPICEANAAKQPDSTTTRLLAELRAYDAALRDFRAAIGLPIHNGDIKVSR
jgi:hypothetical protein